MPSLEQEKARTARKIKIKLSFFIAEIFKLNINLKRVNILI
jgi:hypothetical protein